MYPPPTWPFVVLLFLVALPLSAGFGLVAAKLFDRLTRDVAAPDASGLDER